MKKSRLMSAVYACVITTGFFSSANAAILSPTSIIANTLGELNSDFVDENLINQSGLSSGFISGVTDFDSYLGLSPTQSDPSLSGGGGYASSLFTLSGDIDFDLGGVFEIKRMALWNDRDGQSIGSFTLFISSDSGFVSSTNLGTFLPTTSLTNPVQAEVFDITDGVGQFVRLRINYPQDSGLSIVNFGELAFDVSVSSVPVPAAAWLFGSGLLGLIGMARRKNA